MSDDDDGDEVAIDGDMEPESPTGQPPGDGDDDYDDGDGDGVATGGPIAATLSAPRGQRVISDKVRELAKQIAAKHKAANPSSPTDVPSDDDVDYEAVPLDGASPKPAGGPPPPSPSGVSQPPAGAAPTPPAPTLDPEVTKLRDEWTRRKGELDAREHALLTREQSGDLAKLEEQYFEKGAPAVVELLKKWEGVDGEQLKDAIADLVSDLTIHLGVEVPDEIKDRLETKRTRKQVQRMRAEQGKREERLRKEQETAQAQQDRVRVVGILNTEVRKPEHATQFPWLLAEDDPGAIIADVFDAVKAKDGTELAWTECAKRANDYLKQQSSAYYDKRAHLFTTANKGNGNGQPKQRPQGDPQVIRSQTPPAERRPQQPTPFPMKNGKPDFEAHRRQTKAKLRNAFVPQDDE